MTSLTDRLRRCAAAPAEPPAPTLLLPFAFVRDFLEAHPIVAASGVTASEVYAAILEVHPRYRAPLAAADRTAPTARAAARAAERGADAASPPPDHTSCGECEGYVELDHREGNLVCVSCGLVQQRASVGVDPVFVEAPSEAPRRRTQSSDALAGVPHHLRLKHAAKCPDDDARSEHWRDLQHYNAFVRLSHDDLVRMDRVLARWSAGASRPQRAWSPRCCTCRSAAGSPTSATCDTLSNAARRAPRCARRPLSPTSSASSADAARTRSRPPGFAAVSPVGNVNISRTCDIFFS